MSTKKLFMSILVFICSLSVGVVCAEETIKVKDVSEEYINKAKIIYKKRIDKEESTQKINDLVNGIADKIISSQEVIHYSTDSVESLRNMLFDIIIIKQRKIISIQEKERIKKEQIEKEKREIEKREKEEEVKRLEAMKRKKEIEKRTQRKQDGIYIYSPNNPIKRKIKYAQVNGTVRDRIDVILRNYGRPFSWFQNPRIKEEVLICIAKSETGMGYATNSATPNNIMNYGNSDGGARSDIGMKKSVQSVIYALTKGKYMRGHQTLGTMSGGGRKALGLPGCNQASTTQKCYASSMYNWTVNVSNCLSYIHQKPIREDFVIRK